MCYKSISSISSSIHSLRNVHKVAYHSADHESIWPLNFVDRANCNENGGEREEITKTKRENKEPCLRICIATTSDRSRLSQQTRLTSTLSIVPLPRNRFRGLVTNTIWLVSCSALDGLIGARLRSTYPGLLRRGAQTSTDDQEIAEAGEPRRYPRFRSSVYSFVWHVSAFRVAQRDVV